MIDPLLLKLGSSALKKAALNQEAKTYLLSNSNLFKLLKKGASRYIGGEKVDEALEVVRQKNSSGFTCTVDFMGEDAVNEKEANQATEEFLKLAQALNKNSLNASISLDLSHIGLSVDVALAKKNICLICEKATQANQEVIISAEGIQKTNFVIDTYKYASTKYTNVGITLQAYLPRTKDDFEDLLKLPGKIRIVKGAFDTPPGLSIERGDVLSDAYLTYVDRLLKAEHACSIATHDEKIQDAVQLLIKQYNANTHTYEFESLLGIKNDLLEKLKMKGHPCKVYIVYGREWYLYVCNRLAEYPPNIFQFLADVVE